MAVLRTLPEMVINASETGGCFQTSCTIAGIAHPIFLEPQEEKHFRHKTHPVIGLAAPRRVSSAPPPSKKHHQENDQNGSIFSPHSQRKLGPPYITAPYFLSPCNTIRTGDDRYPITLDHFGIRLVRSRGIMSVRIETPYLWSSGSCSADYRGCWKVRSLTRRTH